MSWRECVISMLRDLSTVTDRKTEPYCNALLHDRQIDSLQYYSVCCRLRVALDVVEGVHYLYAQ